ncbi:MAG: hypothetical protein ACI4KG_06095 [Oscillospiraceae bacterium]
MKRLFILLLVAAFAATLTACSEKTAEEITVTEPVAAEMETTVETEPSSAAETSLETEAETEEAASETNIEPKLAQHEDLIGAWTFENEVLFIFEEDRYIELSGGLIEVINDKVKDGKIELSEEFGAEMDITASVLGDNLICETLIDGESSSIPFVRYNQPVISADFLDGKWYSNSYLELGLWDWGWFSFENGTGTFDSGDKDMPDLPANISISDDKLIFTVGDYSSEYTYYTIDYPRAYRKHIYLLSEENNIELIQHY